MNRRDMLKAGAALACTALAPAPRCQAQSTQRLLRVAAVGVGNQGWRDLQAIAASPAVRVVALCDVDRRYLDQARANYPDAAAFRDYRVLLEEAAGEIDAVLVATPDHMHAAIALDAMSRGKHVYVEKPLAHSIAEVRRMSQAATERGVVTQMGTQIHSQAAYRTAIKLLRDGVIGKALRTFCWIGRSLPGQGSQSKQTIDQPPEWLDWELWQGVAPSRPYIEGRYHPENWRIWRNFGTGALGDMGCHLLDPIFSGLELGPPVSVTSAGPGHDAETYAVDADIKFDFAANERASQGFNIRWMHGALAPGEATREIPAGEKLPESGSLTVGEQGVMVLPHWAMPLVYRNGRRVDYQPEPQQAPDHYQEWVSACLGEGQTSTPLQYGATVTETALVGVAAGDFPAQVLRWDSPKLAFNDPSATALVSRQYRDGWRPLGL